MKKIVFFGTPEHSQRVVKDFFEDDRFEVVGVVSNPDRPVGRKKVMTAAPVKAFAEQNNIDCITPEKFSDEEEEWLKNKNADFFVIVAYGTLIPQSIIDIPRVGTFNLHFSLLPKYRGASPVQAAIVHGDEKNTGISIFKLVEKMDAGEVFVQSPVDISQKNFVEALEKMTQTGSKVFREMCADITLFEQKAFVQNENDATFCAKISKSDGEIDLVNDEAQEIIRKFLAFFLWPGIFFFDGEKKRVKILDIALEPFFLENNAEEGTFFMHDKKCFLKTKNGCIECKILQKEGKKSITGRDFFAQHSK
jgi:methionyl-tRNA formyltransferase